VAFLFFAWMVPEKGQPTWVLESRAKPMLISGGAWLMSLLPDDPESAIIKRLRNPDFLPTDTTAGEEETPAAGDGTAPAEGTPAPAPAQPSSN
jgi:membrane protein required for colicin V production